MANPESSTELLPDSIRSRIDAEFSDGDRIHASQLLAEYIASSGESDITQILEAILNQSNGRIEALRSLIRTAKQDWRDLFYSSRNDPFHLTGRLLKNLRFTKIFSDDEVAEIKRESGVRYEIQFNAILEQIKTRDKRITTQQHVRIIEIGGLLGYPKHQFDWLSDFSDTGTHKSTTPRKPWWKLW